MEPFLLSKNLQAALGQGLGSDGLFLEMAKLGFIIIGERLNGWEEKRVIYVLGVKLSVKVKILKVRSGLRMQWIFEG